MGSAVGTRIRSAEWRSNHRASNGAVDGRVRFILQNLHFLLKNPGFLLKNVDFLMKNDGFIIKQHNNWRSLVGSVNAHLPATE